MFFVGWSIFRRPSPKRGPSMASSFFSRTRLPNGPPQLKATNNILFELLEGSSQWRNIDVGI